MRCKIIEFKSGDLLQSQADALVNAVNCVGIMGKGIALQFRQQFPENYQVYAHACINGELEPGKLLITATGQSDTRFIINFPTKRDWRGKSKMEYIEDGLQALVLEIKARGITSIAIPALGCGNGGLFWEQVRPLIEETLSPLINVQVLIFEPPDAPSS